MDQEFGSEPLNVRESKHYLQEYTPDFVDHWDLVANWNVRDRHEGSFYIDLLKAYGCKRVLDLATGTGYHSIKLLQAGFVVDSLDGCQHMLSKASQNAHEHGQVLSAIHCDWSSLTPQTVNGYYDAVICLGNSFTHLFESDLRQIALHNFAKVLAPTGKLIIDHRNYDAIILGNHTRPAEYYSGPGTESYPEYVDEGLARYRYNFADGNHFYLNMFPIRLATIVKEASTSGLHKVATFYDLSAEVNDQASFVQHVFEKLN